MIKIDGPTCKISGPNHVVLSEIHGLLITLAEMSEEGELDVNLLMLPHKLGWYDPDDKLESELIFISQLYEACKQ